MDFSQTSCWCFLCQHQLLWSGKSCTPQTKVAFHLMAYVNLQVSPTNCIGVSLCTEQSVHLSLEWALLLVFYCPHSWLEKVKWQIDWKHPWDVWCVQILSNGLYKNAMHLAAVNESKSWLTVATGLFPAGSLVIRPAPELIDDEHPALFKSTTTDDFKMVKNKQPVAPLKHLSFENRGWHSGSSQLPCCNNN